METRNTLKWGKKLLAVTLALMLCVPAFAALAESSDETVELTYWAQTDRQNAFDPLTEAYCAEHPNVKITLSYYDTDGIKDACKVGASSGTLPSMWFNWGGSLGSYYAENGCTYDLTTYAEANDWTNKFNPGVLSLCTLDGQLCGYPTNISVLGVFYNKSVFEKYGITAPTTFDELEQVCATLKENGVVPFSTAGLYGWHVMRILEQFIEYYAGSELHDQLQAMTTSWNCEPVIQALTKYQEWCQKGYFPDGFLTNDPNDTFLAVAIGQCAMDLQGQWYDSTILGNDLSVDDYDWYAFPNGTGRMSAFAEMTQLNANLTDAQLNAAIDYLDYIFSNESAQSDYSKYMNLPLPTLDTLVPETQPHVSEMYDYSKEYGTFTITDQAFPTVVADVLFDMQDALYSGTVTPEEAAANIDEAVQSYLASN